MQRGRRGAKIGSGSSSDNFQKSDPAPVPEPETPETGAVKLFGVSNNYLFESNNYLECLNNYLEVSNK